jgi:hypothetical protein
MLSLSIQSILIILLFAFCNNCQSQTLDNDYIAIVSADKMNVLYAGVDNPITAGITGIPASQITASIVGCDATITPTEPGKYVVRAKSAGKVTMTLSGKNKDGKIITQILEFRAKYHSDPIPMVGSKNGGTMSVGEWKEQRGVATEYHDLDICDGAKVLSFSMTLIQNNDTLTCTNKGAKFEGFCYELQQRAKANSIYLIDSIVAIGPGEHFRNLEEMYFKIR